MQLLISIEELANYRAKELVPLKCYHCKNIFRIEKKRVTSILKETKYQLGKFCSNTCCGLARVGRITLICTECDKPFSIRKSQVKKSKNHFCSNSCAGYWNNRHKTKGLRRSKLEIWVETKLLQTYSILEFKFNHRSILNKELDIFIPSLNLAFELNGICHYSPIYGMEKLTRIQRNDRAKIAECQNLGIKLIVIDTRKLNKFSESIAMEYLEFINNEIKTQMVFHSSAALDS